MEHHMPGIISMLMQEKTMSDDKQLKQAVLDELKWEPSVNAAHIGLPRKMGL